MGVVVASARKRKRTTKPPDHGTPEAQRHKRELVGDGDPTLASYPLGVLLARKVIDQDQHNAGDRYASIARTVLGVGAREPTLGLGADPKRDARTEQEWRQCGDALLSCGAQVKQATDEVCVHNRLPRDIDAAIIGLRTLCKVFYVGKFGRSGVDRTPQPR